MSVFFQLIYDAALYPDIIGVSDPFSRGLFIVFDIPGLPLDEGIEIGFTLTIKVGVIGREIEKDIVLPSLEFQRTLNSFKAIEIPREYSDSGYAMQCGFHSSREVDLFRVYVVYSDITLDTLKVDLDEIKNLLGVVTPVSTLPVLGVEASGVNVSNIIGVVV